MEEKDYMKLYADIEVKFLFYYKYTFYYAGRISENLILIVRTGGCAEDIYRWEVSYNDTQLVKHFNESVTDFRLIDNDGNTLESKSSYSFGESIDLELIKSRI